jgi:di/tricarboxylate transporter
MRRSTTARGLPTHATCPALKKNLIAAVVFLVVGLLLANLVPTIEIAWVSTILLLAIYLFAFEVVGVDVAAVTAMVLLGLTSLLAPLIGLQQGLVPTTDLFNGFSSNAVISIIGAGLDKTGIMSQVAAFILRISGSTEGRIIPLLSSTVGFISSFMQNVGAAALFLPVVSRISARIGLPLSRLLMPMGFCAILGGTITMVSSSPLILLNDLIHTSNQSLQAGQQMETFSLFAVTPIGLALVITGIVYFILAGKFVLPANKAEHTEGHDTASYFSETYGLQASEVYEVVVPAESPLVGVSVDELEQRWKVRIIAVEKGDGLRLGADSIDRGLGIEAGTVLGLLGTEEYFTVFSEESSINRRNDLETFANSLATAKAGIAEVVIPPSSNLVGKTARDVWMRKTFGLSLLAIHRGEEIISCRTGGVRQTPFRPGDTLVVHTAWTDLPIWSRIATLW